ncbi:MAG: hypothetical protein HOV81_43480 [Kofleriaceae bacterium]|nr:hypothetical protein [Kofleriaceae bacterium]
MKRLAAVLALAASPAFAEQPSGRPEAVQLDRDAPPPGQVELGFDGGAPIQTWALSAQLGFLDRPMRLHTTEIEVFPVEQRETLALGAAIALGTSAIADIRMPFSHQSGDRWQGLGDERALDAWVLGDLALGARLRIAQRAGASIFARAQLTLPTGDDHDFAGDARYSVAWNLIGRFSLPGGLVIAATAGVRFRGREVQLADRLVGDELTGAIGATYEIPAIPGLWCPANRVRATAEVDGVLGNDVAGERGPSPLEGRIGLVGKIRPWLAVGVRIGKGLDDQIGAPRFRGLLEVAFEPGAE